MFPDLIQFIDKRAALQLNPCHSRNVVRGIIRAVRRSLMSESQRQAEETETEIGACMEPSARGKDPCRAYAILKLWYWHASAWAPNLSQIYMEKVGGDL